MKSKLPPDLQKYPCRNTSFVNLPKERWKPIPCFEEYYEISDYGRVKALAREITDFNGRAIHKKEKMRSAGVSPAPNKYTGDFTYQLSISMQVNNKTSNFSIGRLVYYCFIETFDLDDHTLYLVQKDGNGLNCYYKNLILVNANFKQKRIYKQERNVTCFSWLDMKAIAQKDLKRRMKPITQYTDNGKMIKTFESIKAASEATGIPRSNICAVANGYWSHAGGYVWRHGEGPPHIDLTTYFEARKKAYTDKRGKKIAQYTLARKKINTFPSIMEASRQTGISISLISRAVNGILKNTRGFIWRQIK